MPLSEEQKEIFGNWLHARNSDPKCPSCGRNEWSFGDIISPPAYDKDAAPDGPAPMVQLICKYCAFVRLHAAEPIGLLDKKRP